MATLPDAPVKDYCHDHPLGGCRGGEQPQVVAAEWIGAKQRIVVNLPLPEAPKRPADDPRIRTRDERLGRRR
jgi:hypothetical protein